MAEAPHQDIKIEVGKTYITKQYDLVSIVDVLPDSRIVSGKITDIFVGILNNDQKLYTRDGIEVYLISGQEKYAPIVPKEIAQDIIELDNDIVSVKGKYLIYKKLPKATELSVSPEAIVVEELQDSQELQIITNAKDYSFKIDTKIATFSKDSKKITGVAEGDTTLTIKAQADNSIETTKQVSVKVTKATPLPATELKSDAQQINVKTTQQVQVNITTNADTISASVEDDTKASCSTQDKAITIEGIASGNTNLIVKATAQNSLEATLQIPIIVTDSQIP